MSTLCANLRPLVTGHVAKHLDHLAIERFGFAPGVLMESAGRGACHELMGDRIAPGWCPVGGTRQAEVLVVCGKGHNAGDALVCARYLVLEGIARIDVALLTPLGELAEETARNLERLRRFQPAARVFVLPGDGSLGQRLCQKRYDLVLDGILGIGIRGEVAPPFARAIGELNTHRESFGTCVVSMDVPSGLDADTGEVAGAAVRADHTLTFGASKLGLHVADGPAHGGRVHLVRLPFPAMAGDAVDAIRLDRLFDRSDRTGSPPRLARINRPAEARHKYDRGVVVVVGGSRGLTGAVRMSALSAWRRGAGAVLLAFPAGLHGVLAAGERFPILHPIGHDGQTGFRPDDIATLVELLRSRPGTLLIGPGLGPEVHDTGFVPELLASLPDVPTVADADALRGWRAEEVLPGHRRTAPLVLTPHPGEAAELFGSAATQTAVDRIERAREAAQRLGAHICSKGDPVAALSPDGVAVVGAYSSRPFNRAGAGDTLAGRIAATLSFGADPLHCILDALLEGLDELAVDEGEARAHHDWASGAAFEPDPDSLPTSAPASDRPDAANPFHEP